MQYRFIFFLIFTLIEKNIHSDEQHIPYGIMIIINKNCYDFICYNRKQLQTGANINWSAQIDPKNLKFQDITNLNNCIKKSIESCEWIFKKKTVIKISFVYSLEFAQEFGENAINIRKIIFNGYVTRINTNQNNFELSLANHVRIDKKYESILNLLETKFNAYKGYLDQTAFITVKRDIFDVGIFTNSPHLYDETLIQRFSFHGTEYSVVLNNFYCLTINNIQAEIYTQLYEKSLSSVIKKNDVIITPCFIDRFMLIQNSSSGNTRCNSQNRYHSQKILEGKYDFDSCISLIRKVFRISEICGNDKYCNLSPIKEEFFGKNIGMLRLHTKFSNFHGEYLHSVLLQEEILEWNKKYCATHPHTNARDLNTILLNSSCFDNLVFYAILTDEFLINKEIKISKNELYFSCPVLNYRYLFLDPIFGLIINEQPKLPVRQFETSTETLTITPSTVSEKMTSEEPSTFIMSPIEEDQPSLETLEKFVTTIKSSISKNVLSISETDFEVTKTTPKSTIMGSGELAIIIGILFFFVFLIIVIVLVIILHRRPHDPQTRLGKNL